jgi:hypothetical protein
MMCHGCISTRPFIILYYIILYDMMIGRYHVCILLLLAIILPRHQQYHYVMAHSITSSHIRHVPQVTPTTTAANTIITNMMETIGNVGGSGGVGANGVGVTDDGYNMIYRGCRTVPQLNKPVCVFFQLETCKGMGVYFNATYDGKLVIEQSLTGTTIILFAPRSQLTLPFPLLNDI